jgi:hypothetical protein
VRGPDGCYGLKNCAEDTSVSSSSFSGGAGHGLLRKTEAGTPFNKHIMEEAYRFRAGSPQKAWLQPASQWSESAPRRG